MGFNSGFKGLTKSRNVIYLLAVVISYHICILAGVS